MVVDLEKGAVAEQWIWECTPGEEGMDLSKLGNNVMDPDQRDWGDMVNYDAEILAKEKAEGETKDDEWWAKQSMI